MLGPWTRRQASFVGQVAEFLVWGELEGQSGGGLHVYLPLWDRGIDAVVRRVGDGVFLPVQVKSRSALDGGVLRLAVWAGALTDDRALLIGAHLDGGGLGPRLLVVEE